MTNASDPPVILWFRNDLRLADHAALQAAVETGQPVMPVFILDDTAPGPWALGRRIPLVAAPQPGCLPGTCGAGSHLTLRRATASGSSRNSPKRPRPPTFSPAAPPIPGPRQVDKAASEALAAKLHRMRTTTLFHPDSVRTKTGGAYSVYTPFANACLALGGPKAAVAGSGNHPRRPSRRVRPA